MADLEASAVTKRNGWLVRHPGRSYTLREFDLVLTGQGTVANAITAAVLGFEQITMCENGVLSDNSEIIVATPSADGSKLLLKAAGTNAPATYTGVTLRIRVGGFI